MRSISVADLCNRSEEVLDELRAGDVPYLVTSGDESVALLSPLAAAGPAAKPAKERAAGEGWKSYLRLAEGLRASWPAGRDSKSLLRGLRGEP